MDECTVPRRVGILLFRQVQALDVTGPMDAFAAASASGPGGSRSPAYEVFTVAASKRTLVAESGLSLKPQYCFDSCPEMHTLVIPGGCGLRDPRVADRLAPWIAHSARQVQRVAAVCTGTFGLAATGLLRGRRVTTHWRFAAELSARYPELRVEANALYLKDGPFYTSAGITAGIDLTLALIEEDLGRAASLKVARELVVYLRRSGGQAQYSEPLEFEARAVDRFGDISRWIAVNLHRKITVEALARRASLSPRQVSRRFRADFGMTPAEFVERLRMQEAQRRLATSNSGIKRLAASLGYQSPHVFRRAFERSFGVSPRTWRDRFGVSPAAPGARPAAPSVHAPAAALRQSRR
jgi:transcriptional regulator GlxA family with amidase domain